MGTQTANAEQIVAGEGDYMHFEVPNTFNATSRWKHLKTNNVIVNQSIMKGEKKIKNRSFVFSLPLGMQYFPKAVRKHWEIETTCH